MKKIQLLLLIAISFLLSQTTFAGKGIDKLASLQNTDKYEFNPSIGETFPISFNIAKEGIVNITITTADDDTVFKHISPKPISPGNHKIYWDGKDSKGIVVPDEAYNISLEVNFTDGTTYSDIPSNYSGGEIITPLKWKHGKKGNISFSINDPARVLIRAGIKNGPMLKSLARWTPKAPGRVVERWDGYDQDKIEKISNRKDLWILVMAYKLPKFSIITTGNKKINYKTYRKSNKFPEKNINISQIKLRRNGIRLEKDFFYPRGFEPALKAKFIDKLKMSRHNIPQVDEITYIEASIPLEDRWIMESAMYEVVYYLDYEFQSEEEQGFIPFVWKLDPSKLKPGRHIATIQLTGYSGFVVSKSIEFFIK